VLSVRASRDVSEVETASDTSLVKAAGSVVSEVLSEVHTASDESVQHGAVAGSPVLSQSAQTAADSSAIDSPLSSVHTSPRTAVDSSAIGSPLPSVHTSPSFQHQQPAAELPQQPNESDKGLFLHVSMMKFMMTLVFGLGYVTVPYIGLIIITAADTVSTKNVVTGDMILGIILHVVKVKGKGRVYLFMELHLTAMGCHLPYGITQYYLPPDTSEHTPPQPQPDRPKDDS